jgi:hypothetical protein
MRKKDNIKMMVNNYLHCHIENGKQAIEAILSLGIEQLKYMSEDGIRKWIEGSLDIVEETLEWRKDNALKKRIVTYRKSLEYPMNRESIMNHFTNILLSCAGLTTLTGFGMANTESKGGRMKAKGKLLINPEKRSIRG